MEGHVAGGLNVARERFRLGAERDRDGGGDGGGGGEQRGEGGEHGGAAGHPSALEAIRNRRDAGGEDEAREEHEQHAP